MCIMAFALPPPFFGRIHKEMSPEEAIEFGRRLRDAIKQLRDDTVEASKEADTAAKADPDDDTVKGIDASDWEFPIEPALKEIEQLPTGARRSVGCISVSGLGIRCRSQGQGAPLVELL